MKSSVVYTLVAFLICCLPFSDGGTKPYSNIERISDIQDFKKILRTRTNVLVLFAKNDKAASKALKVLDEAGEAMKGLATIIFLDCSDAPKLCKKLKVSPSTVVVQHFKDGEYNRDYDRPLILKSVVSFLHDPTGDVPWDEEPTANDVIHILSIEEFQRHLAKQKLPSLMMFYAPWCGFCKQLKPQFAAAATEVKSTANLVGIDVDKPHMQPLSSALNITGFPTLFYFEKGQLKSKYGGEMTKEGIVKWLANPTETKEASTEEAWSDVASDVVHLTDDTFDAFVAITPSLLVMFYAPWCGHCKSMKPQYEEAAALLKRDNIEGVLAAVDATKEKELGQRFGVKGFPTVKYLRNGTVQFDMQERTADRIVEFMKDPKAPPAPPAPEPAWEDTESDVIHLSDATFKPSLKKKKHALVMFYAPWCGHCKKAKPHYANAAAKFKDDSKVAFAAVDCTIHTAVCSEYDVKGYPTIKYLSHGKNAQIYAGGREEEDFVSFMNDPLNPKVATPPPVQDLWAGVAGAESVLQLTTASFAEVITSNPSVLIMFYAPWCGHCKSMKSAYAAAAADLKKRNVNGALAAVDGTVERELAEQYNIRGFPTLKYFAGGEFAFDFNERSYEKIISFMENPQDDSASSGTSAPKEGKEVPSQENKRDEL